MTELPKTKTVEWIDGPFTFEYAFTSSNLSYLGIQRTNGAFGFARMTISELETFLDCLRRAHHRVCFLSKKRWSEL